jgi:beta-1,4-mannosyltransferase
MVSAGEGAARLVVLESFGPPHAETNPYSILLFDSLRQHVEPQYFSWRAALRADYDVLHLHWPEVKVLGATPLKSLLRSLAFLAVLVRVRWGRPVLVRTLHDLHPHEPPTRLQRWIIGLSERWTTLWICLNDRTPPPTAAPSVLIPHGHYRDRFAAYDRPEPVSGRLVHFGLLRPYKGVDALLRAVEAIDDPRISLRVVGKVMDPALGDELRDAAASDPRITVRDGFVPDEVLADEIGRAELVVLPFRSVTNSGSLILALSLDRPVLVSRSAASEEMAREVGAAWVHLYDGELTPATIEQTLREVRNGERGRSPDLSARDWERIGELHAEAFRRAVELGRATRR